MTQEEAPLVFAQTKRRPSGKTSKIAECGGAAREWVCRQENAYILRRCVGEARSSAGHCWFRNDTG